MKRRFIAFSALLLAVRVSPVAGDSADDNAMAIALLARMNKTTDVQYLSHYLRLPNLERDLTWQGPASETQASDFSAFYFPPDSPLGIAEVLLRRQTGGTVRLDGKAAELHSVSLTFKPDACPRKSSSVEAIGSKPTQTVMPGFDGGPSFKTTTFFVPQSQGEPVQIKSLGNDTCHVSILHMQPL